MHSFACSPYPAEIPLLAHIAGSSSIGACRAAIHVTAGSYCRSYRCPLLTRLTAPESADDDRWGRQLAPHELHDAFG